jgi:hypothetical protein
MMDDGGVLIRLVDATFLHVRETKTRHGRGYLGLTHTDAPAANSSSPNRRAAAGQHKNKKTASSVERRLAREPRDLSQDTRRRVSVLGAKFQIRLY